uniref:Ig-like domain-containing protein n=1 Tax=Anopheles atroparvus TaxID=41427 RepID=A0AAG5CSI9_ANOAO
MMGNWYGALPGTSCTAPRPSRPIGGGGLKRFISIGILLQIIANCDYGFGAIRSVKLVVEPAAVRRGQHATLRCLYDLDDSPLYSVKFYRGLREFYRYSPGQQPSMKIFPFPGINVDAAHSDNRQVVIRNVGFGLSGNFSCEVTADAPSFSTATEHISMQVVELPDSGPTLWTEHTRYEPGDVLRANCTSQPSRPKAELTLTLNNMVVYTSHEETRTTTDNLISSSLTLRLHLQSSHFGSGLMPGMGGPSAAGGALLLRCTATIGKLYEQYTELELGVPQRDPIPARVTSSSATRIFPSAGLGGWSFLLLTALLALALCNKPSLAPISPRLVGSSCSSSGEALRR